MIESARLNGVQIDGSARLHFQGPEGLFPASDKFFEAVEECQHFVFQPKAIGGPIDAEENSSKELDAPFKVFSIEMIGQKNHISVSRHTDEADISITCILAYEWSPRKYILYTHAVSLSNPNMSRVIITEASFDIVRSFIDRLNKEETGVQKVKERIKIGTGPTKRTVEIRKITYVSPKRSISKVRSDYSFPIDWSHRWFVRGHWRELSPNQLGKDRAGEYCVAGMTWVKEHEKGNPEKELINKVRFVST